MRQGESYLIVDRNVPVARLEPVDTANSRLEGLAVEAIASAVVSLLVSDRFSARSRDLLAEDELSDCLSGLESLTNTWVEVQPISQVRSIALRLLRVHPLRAADAMHLASAIAVAAEDRRSISFVCYDDRLLRAADRKGFPVLGATP